MSNSTLRKEVRLIDKIIKSTEFSLSVVSGNPVSGDTPEEKEKNALELYLSAKKGAVDRNEKLKSDDG